MKDISSIKLKLSRGKGLVSVSSNSTKFCNALDKSGMPNWILNKREIDYYFPTEVIRVAQQGDENKVKIDVLDAVLKDRDERQ